MSVKLSELLDQKPFRVRLETRTASTDRVLTGAYATEWPEPGRWLAPGHLVMTNGIALRGSVAKQRRFVEEVHGAGAAGICLSVPATFKTVPPAMLETAEALGLPIMTTPYDLPFREITAFVMRSALGAEARHLSRAMTTQDFLLGALDDPEPFSALVRRLHDVLRAPAAAFSPVGRILAAAGNPPLDVMWDAVCAGEHVVPLERGYIFTSGVSVGEIPYAHLVVRLRDDPRPAGYARSVVHFAARVMQMIALASYAGADQERVAKAALLRELLDAPAINRALLERLAVFGFDSETDVRILVGEARSHASNDAEVQVAAAAIFARRHIPNLVDVRGGDVIALFDSTEFDLATLQDFVEGDGALLSCVGTGLPAVISHDAQRGLREAQIALLRGRRETRRVVSFEDIGLADLLLSYLPRERLTSASRVLAPLRADRPDLLETLKVYLAHDSNVVTSAKALNLHANSLRYRLSMIERILGRSLRSLDTLLELTLALRIDAIMDANGDVPPAKPRTVSGSGA
jgi:hypothetical protein